ncbi:MAG: NAD(P)/FAD-dependent oxidoreductase [Clostridiaceae bacterium]|jgi:hypothetical protein|nr:NAD(P)/FAD-dependent oxidoreductase [Clostridiaceae bacterium]
MGKKTVIVGGGIAGMSCALRLKEMEQDYLLVTDVLGGRIQYSSQKKVNYGAYFVMENYINAKKLLTEGQIISPLNACFYNSNTEYFPVISLNTIKILPELIRFYFALKEFSRHYEKFKKNCMVMPQKDALSVDPYMADLYSKLAVQFVREKRFERAASDYVSKFAYGCTGTSIENLTAFDALNVSMGILIPIRHIRFDIEAIENLFQDHLIYDTIERIDSKPGLHKLVSKTGRIYEAENVVIATQASITQKLLALPEIRKASSLYVFHVKAKLKPIYQKYELNLFPAASEIVLTARQVDGTYMIYTREENADLLQLCESFEVLATKAWEKAMYVQGNSYMEQEFGNGLFVAGDHNGLGLEPAAISGIFAANQIIKQN